MIRNRVAQFLGLTTSSAAAEREHWQNKKAQLPDPADQLTARERAQAESRDALALAYKLAKLDRATPSNPAGRSGNAAIWESHDLMHRRVRAAYLNNPLFRRLAHVIRDLVVGGGINAFSDPIDYSFGWKLDGRSDAELDRAIEYALESDEKFEAWANDKNAVDVGGRLSWWDLQRMVMLEVILVGSVLVVECSRSDTHICYKLVEREQIHTQMDRPGSKGADGKWQNAIVNGFELDRDGREVAVYIWDEHPHDYNNPAGTSYGHQRLPSDRYEHIFLGTRPSQTVGATMLHAIGTVAADRDKFTDAELRTAVKAALHLLVHKTKNPNSGALGFENEEEFEGYGDDAYLGSDPLAVQTHTEDEFELLESNRPTDKANNFFDILDHDIAGGADVSYYSATGRFEKTNYGGFKGAMNLEDSQMMPIQAWLGRVLVLPIRRRWNQLAVGLGKIENVTATEFARDKTRLQRFDVVGPGRKLLDSDAETQGDQAELRSAMATLKEKCMRRGKHWLRVLRQIALENRIAARLGVRVDHSKGNGGNAGDQQSESTAAILATLLAYMKDEKPADPPNRQANVDDLVGAIVPTE